jgi:hypothetical protein
MTSTRVFLWSREVRCNNEKRRDCGYIERGFSFFVCSLYRCCTLLFFLRAVGSLCGVKWRLSRRCVPIQSDMALVLDRISSSKVTIGNKALDGLGMTCTQRMEGRLQHGMDLIVRLHAIPNKGPSPRQSTSTIENTFGAKQWLRSPLAFTNIFQIKRWF